MIGNKLLNLGESIKDRIIAARTAAEQGLKTRFFDNWQPVLDEALDVLPESTICSHELYRAIIQNPSPTRKRIILVTERSEPVALVGIREKANFWEPVTQWLVPGIIFPVKENYLWRVLGALGLTLHVGLWRWGNQTPPLLPPLIKDFLKTPTHGMGCSEDFEAYWKQSSQYKNLKKARNRCKGFELRINDPGTREWTICNWGAKWGVNGMPELSDRLLLAQYLNTKGLLYTLSLHEKGKIAAGAIMLIHNNDAVAYVNHRDPEYNRYGVMNYLIGCCFSWAKEMALDRIDIGGSANYKKNWAPEAGYKFEFNVVPYSRICESRPFSIVNVYGEILYCQRLWKWNINKNLH